MAPRTRPEVIETCIVDRMRSRAGESSLMNGMAETIVTSKALIQTTTTIIAITSDEPTSPKLK